MEKNKAKSIIVFPARFFRFVTSGNMNPQVSWEIVIVAAMLASVALGITAYMSYQWASNAKEVVLTKKLDKEAVSAEDIRDVVDFYNAKQKKFNELIKTGPVAPELGAGSGVIISEIVNVREELMRAENLDLPDTSLPN